MKKTKLFTGIFISTILLTVSNVFSQTKPKTETKKTNDVILTDAMSSMAKDKAVKGTSLEEYNYITKGYKVQLESGLDMKKGYMLSNLDFPNDMGSLDVKGADNITRNYELKALYRTGQKNPCALMLHYKNTSDKSEIYICIPNPDSDEELQKKYYSDMTNFALEAEKGLAYALSVNLMYQLWIKK